MLMVFVEGEYDEHFFKEIIGLGSNEYRTSPYAHLKKEKIISHTSSIRANKFDDFIFVLDADGKTVQEAIEYAKNNYKLQPKDKVIVVAYEMESWLMAGIDCKKLKDLGFKKNKSITSTDNFKKQDFKNLLEDETDYYFVYANVVEKFKSSLAVRRNQTYKSFFEKYKLLNIKK